MNNRQKDMIFFCIMFIAPLAFTGSLVFGTDSLSAAKASFNLFVVTIVILVVFLIWRARD